MKQRQGFTILELSIVIIILTILLSLTMISIGSVRETNRNNQRVADINNIQLALKMYYRDWGSYPIDLPAPGQPLISGSNTYLLSWPTNPAPRNDGVCPDTDYVYTATVDSGTGRISSYRISFCLSQTTGNIGKGVNFAEPDNIVTCLSDCVRSCGAGSDGCGGTCSNVASCVTGETCYNDHCIKD